MSRENRKFQAVEKQSEQGYIAQACVSAGEREPTQDMFASQQLLEGEEEQRMLKEDLQVAPAL